jgi:hypothetical protein
VIFDAIFIYLPDLEDAYVAAVINKSQFSQLTSRKDCCSEITSLDSGQ